MGIYDEVPEPQRYRMVEGNSMRVVLDPDTFEVWRTMVFIPLHRKQASRPTLISDNHERSHTVMRPKLMDLFCQFAFTGQVLNTPVIETVTNNKGRVVGELAMMAAPR